MARPKKQKARKQPSDVDIELARAIIDKRHKPFDTAISEWHKWSRLSEALTLFNATDWTTIAVSLAKLVFAVRLVRGEAELANVTTANDWLPSTVEAITSSLNGEPVAAVAARLEEWSTKLPPYAVEGEITGRLLNVLRSALRPNDRITEAASNATAEADELDGIDTAQSVEAAPVEPPVLVPREIEILRVFVDSPPMTCLTSVAVCEAAYKRAPNLGLMSENYFRSKTVPRLKPWGLRSHGKRGYSLPADAPARRAYGRHG